MVQKPRWLNLATAGIVAMMVIAACTPAGPAATSTRAPTAAAGTATPAAPATGTARPATAAPQSPGGSPDGTPGASPTGEPATPAPTGTPYPEPVAQPPAAAAVTEYPNYGEEIDCEGDLFNGLPYSGSVKRISASDDNTQVTFELCGPDPAFLSKIAFAAFAIHDSDFLLAHAADQSIVTETNGTGPYELEAFQQGEQVVFTENENYWNAEQYPVAADAVLRWSSEAGQKFVELQSGNVDGIDNVQPDDIAAIEADANLQLIDREGFNVFYIGMNRDEPPFNNVKVREAIVRGIDRQALIDEFFPEGSTVADYFTPCIIPFACVGTEFPTFDATEAQRLLAEGLEEENMTMEQLGTIPVSYRVVDRAYLPLPDQVALAIVDQLQQNLGITASPDEQESATFITNANNGRLRGLHLLGWNGDYPDTSNFLDNHFGPGATIQFGQIYTDIADALTRAGSTAVESEREAAYSEANTLLATHFPMLPVAHAGSATAWRANVEGAHSSPLGNEALFAVSGGDDEQVVFMQSGPPGGLYCADETDGESLRACEQIYESLYKYQVGGFEAEPALATECTANEDLSVWTCTLRDGVTFHDGATLGADDVVLSYAVQWDNLHPLHVGRSGNFAYWGGTWGGYLNPDAPCGISGQPACED